MLVEFAIDIMRGGEFSNNRFFHNITFIFFVFLFINFYKKNYTFKNLFNLF